MTNLEVEAFLKSHHTVIVPTGATEQHGPHAPLLTDVLIPNEIARRIAPRSAPSWRRPSITRCRIRTSDSPGWCTSASRRSWGSSRTLALFAASGFKRIIFLNGHYDNTYAIAYACANAADKMGKDVKAFPVNYWDGMTPEDVAEWSGLKNGLQPIRRDIGGDGDQSGPGGSRKGECRVPAVPGLHHCQHRRGAHRVPLHRAWLGLLGDEIRTGGMRGRPPPKRANATSKWACARRSPCSRTSRRPSLRCRRADAVPYPHTPGSKQGGFAGSITP